MLLGWFTGPANNAIGQQPVEGLPPGLPQAMALSGAWQKLPDPSNHGRAANWGAGSDSLGWQAATVPGLFSTTNTDDDYKGTVGWYRLKFVGPQTLPGFGWDFDFEQIRLKADVYLNGRKLGSDHNPYVPYRVAASGIKAGEENTLVVRVDNRRPVDLREGWWNYGGITRAVNLIPRTPIAFEDHAFIPDVRCESSAGCTASVTLDGSMVNRTASPLTPTITATITSPTGKRFVVDKTLDPINGHKTSRTQITFDVDNPELWSPTTPQFYQADVVVKAGGVPVTGDHERFGLRTVYVKNSVLMLNGRQLRLRGAGIVEDMPGDGDALSDADIDKIVADLKGLHATVTRAHYLLDERLLNKLDDNGIMVWSEAAVYHADEDLKYEKGRKHALSTLRQTILRARRHPSVLTHAVGDELAQEPDKTPGTGAYLKDAADLVKSLDTSVPAGLALLSYPNIPKQQVYSNYPLLGLNTYYGWYLGKKGIKSTANLADLKPYLAQMRKKYPTQALAATEFGAEARFTGPSTEKGTYAFQTQYVKKVLDVLDATPYLATAIYWTAREFPVKPDWTGGAKRRDRIKSPMHAKGLIRYNGTPKPAYAVAAARFAGIGPYK